VLDIPTDSDSRLLSPDEASGSNRAPRKRRGSNDVPFRLRTTRVRRLPRTRGPAAAGRRRDSRLCAAYLREKPQARIGYSDQQKIVDVLTPRFTNCLDALMSAESAVVH